MMSPISAISAIFFVLLATLFFKIAIPPLNFPRNIPTIPFYVIFLPVFFKMDQVELYEKYLREPMEKYGAVKAFFGSRWNILVSRPEFLAQVFKDENTFAKSGNQKKIPYSVIATYTGDNVISAHGDIWKLYRTSLNHSLQRFNEAPLWKNAKKFCQLICNQVDVASGSTKVGPLIQRLTLDNISEVTLGFDFGTLNQEKSSLHEHLLLIKKQIFHPLFLTFPFLDLFPIPMRKEAFKNVESFRKILVERVRQNMIENYQFEQTDFAASNLIRSYNAEKINYTQLTDNIVILLVAGHENPQLLITTCLYLLAKYKSTWQQDIWEECKRIVDGDSKGLSELPLLNSFIFEAVRMYPPLNTIINRKTSRLCKLGHDIVIPKDTYVGYNNFGANHYRKSWGSTADEFQPQRWGSDIDTILKTWREKKTTAVLSSFHGGRRACLGEKLALVELRVTIFEVLKQFKLSLSPSWEEKMTPGGPLCPLNLELTCERRT
ncbi:putative cytochrome P450 KNAG_0C04530 [Huiozyma naganishii CBS 8797]|uniref:Dit2p n=1 Tax=Huiozyma naganishii (strain ATCC MYA-139 / BCRC 22969 / CBS 8797 / KCTC 17520 / NBRC 10181 / NCYC 3082 / Yp74L-3) TaxID=1071383 RepID=J7R3Z8_HUIN7|nr:hypothetical protein KNAG_0C04530 [Kazachstania naganishii CBS 8797]CCK69555.1 hypothetical protein KNAG_0C04530 [Kazachstania naganishii CBS 8797]